MRFIVSWVCSFAFWEGSLVCDMIGGFWRETEHCFVIGYEVSHLDPGERYKKVNFGGIFISFWGNTFGDSCCLKPYHTALPYSLAIQPCHTALLYSLAIQPCYTALFCKLLFLHHRISIRGVSIQWIWPFRKSFEGVRSEDSGQCSPVPSKSYEIKNSGHTQL